MTLVMALAIAVAAAWPPQIEQWRGLIYEYAQKNALDPALVAAVIRIESNGDAGAVNQHSGACGLMQVMPVEAKIRPDLFWDRPSCSEQELLNPRFNVRWGTRYLAEQIRFYGIRSGLQHYFGRMDIGFEYADTVLRICREYGGVWCGRDARPERLSRYVAI